MASSGSRWPGSARSTSTPTPVTSADGRPAIDAGATLRDALSLMMTEDMKPVLVTRDGSVIGQVSIERINAALREVRDDAPRLSEAADPTPAT